MRPLLKAIKISMEHQLSLHISSRRQPVTDFANHPSITCSVLGEYALPYSSINPGISRCDYHRVGQAIAELALAVAIEGHRG
jgi:hypothetical protein